MKNNKNLSPILKMSQGQTKWIQLPAGHDMTAMVLSAHAMKSCEHVVEYCSQNA
ncbi:hypothetical protein N473_05285 [Pseudoalteromonas luteoviolacea CPMOR-1]|uniref:Uncharacterized protein n=1 Tax=Pseudoalteromonas luteoviolacea CPMOR-1 TaxID=1365248 RepID=A0A167HHX0_9GAMM|nr:hypothetical protein N473_05285 [Pseudoalteromonas luteoviolacea CPMOR-1]